MNNYSISYKYNAHMCIKQEIKQVLKFTKVTLN